MRLRPLILTALALALAPACGDEQGPAPGTPPPAAEPPPAATPPPAAPAQLVDFARNLITTQTADTLLPLALPGDEVLEGDALAEPFYDAAFFQG